jgi:hypothetical protein
LTDYVHDMTDSFYSYEFPNYPTFKATSGLKALSTAITRSIFAQKIENLKGIHVGETQEEFNKMNQNLKSSGFDFTMDQKHTKFYSVQAKFSKENQKLKYWLLRLVSEKKFNPITMFNEAKQIGASLLRKGDIVTFTIVYTTDTAAYTKDVGIIAYFETTTTALSLVGSNADDGSKARFALRDSVQKDGQNCGSAKTKAREVKYTRRRPAFNQYRMVAEMKLMRRYPGVLYHWLKEDKEFNAKAPHANAILEYLKTAKKRREIGWGCVNRDMCAWSYAYHMAYKGDTERLNEGPITYTKNLGSDMSISPTAEIGTNNYNDTYGMVMHKKWSAKLTYGKVYEIDYLQTNDWGSYDLIVNVFLREKNERIWKLLLSDDSWGINQFAMATSKRNGKWRVALLWYESVVNEYCVSQAEKSAANLGNDNCLDGYFNFYARRWHDYDYTKGTPRKDGEGESGADKPKPGDGPNDNPPKPPRTPAFVPPVSIDDDKPKTPIIRIKPPKTKPSTPKEVRKANDKATNESIAGKLTVRQVVEVHKKFRWLKRNA